MKGGFFDLEVRVVPGMPVDCALLAGTGMPTVIKNIREEGMEEELCLKLWREEHGGKHYYYYLTGVEAATEPLEAESRIGFPDPEGALKHALWAVEDGLADELWVNRHQIASELLGGTSMAWTKWWADLVIFAKRQLKIRSSITG